MSGTEL